MKHATNSRKIRQFDRLVKSMKAAIREGQPKELVEKIRLKLAVIVQQLRGTLSTGQLAKKLGALAILFGLSTGAYAQTFSLPVADPFGFAVDSTNYVGGICFADFDNDGDLDMMMGGYYGSINYHENIGSATNPSLDAAQVNAFGLTNSSYYAFLTAADLDNDGDIDILAGEYYGAMNYFENTGTATSPAFAAAQVNPFGITPGYVLSMPSFVDIDDDGDYDLFVGEANGGINYFENTGTAASPAFSPAQATPFGLTPGYSFAHPTFADLDQDGDLDLLINEIYGNFQYFENTGTASAPAFGAQQMNPFGITVASNIALSALVDIDADGDYDIMSSAYYGNLFFYENTQFNVGIDELANNVGISPNPFNQQLHLAADTDLESIEVYSVTGALVYQEFSPSKTIVLGDLNPGVYLIKVVDTKGQVTQQKVEKI